jgi:RNA polymerase sigma factor (sigma-70 family)
MTERENAKQLKQHKSKGEKREFLKLLNDFIPHFRKIINHKLRQMEIKGDVPVNMYSAQEIVDEIYLKIFNDYKDEFQDENRLKVVMYTYARDILNSLKEKHRGIDISVEDMVKKELEELEEDFTADAEGEIVMLDDLDDISYHQKEYSVNDNILLIAPEQVNEIAGIYNLQEGNLTEEQTKRIGKTYSRLPELSMSVFDHYVFAKLTFEQIAEIHRISVEKVTQMLNVIKKRFEKVL